MYFICSHNNGADQLHDPAYLRQYAKCRFSHDVDQFDSKKSVLCQYKNSKYVAQSALPHGLICALTLRERLRTHKVLIKDQYFYLNYHKFSVKSYVVDVY